MNNNQGLERVIRKSQYGDYFAVDYVNALGEIKETPLYLKKGQEKNIKMRWDCTVYSGGQNHDQNWMEPAKIRFNGKTVEVTYVDSRCGDYWFEPSEHELKGFHVIHFKV